MCVVFGVLAGVVVSDSGLFVSNGSKLRYTPTGVAGLDGAADRPLSRQRGRDLHLVGGMPLSTCSGEAVLDQLVAGVQVGRGHLGADLGLAGERAGCEVLLLHGAHVGGGQDGGSIRALGHLLVHDDDGGLRLLASAVPLVLFAQETRPTAPTPARTTAEMAP